MIIHQKGDYYTAAKMLMDVVTYDAAYTSSGDHPSCSSRTFGSVRISWAADSCECGLPLPRRPSSTRLRRRCDVDHGIPSYGYHDHRFQHHILTTLPRYQRPPTRHGHAADIPTPESSQVPSGSGNSLMLCIQPPTMIYLPIIGQGCIT